MEKRINTFLETQHPPGSFNAYLTQFLQKQRERVSPATTIHLYRSLSALGQFLDGTQSLAHIQRDQIQQHVADLKLHYAPGTLRPVIGDLKQFFRWCKKRGYHQKNLGKHLKKPRAKHQRPKAAPEDAIQQLIQHLANELRPYLYRDIFGNLQANPNHNWNYTQLKTLNDLAVLLFLYETGCRAGELTNLTTRAMHQATQNLKSSYTITMYGKTNDRSYHFTNTTAEIWRLWEQLRPSPSSWAFWSWKRGHPPQRMTTNGVSQMLARRCQQAGVPSFRAHALRHAKVHRSRRLVGLELASRLIDHSSLTTTRQYDYIEEQELSRAAQLTGYHKDIWRSPASYTRGHAA